MYAIGNEKSGRLLLFIAERNMICMPGIVIKSIFLSKGRPNFTMHPSG
jgi:hypothetical protein